MTAPIQETEDEMRMLKCGKRELLGIDRGARASIEQYSGRFQTVVRAGDGAFLAAHSHAATAWQRAFANVYRKQAGAPSHDQH